ncbi:MAG: hypothetical protein U0264_15645 [Candidatus Kapaibacterium sp.]
MTAKNIEALIGCQVKVDYAEASPLQVEYETLKTHLVQLLSAQSARTDIRQGFKQLYASAFAIRTKAVQMMFESPDLDYSVLFADTYEQVSDFAKNERLEVLVENLHFALRCNKEIYDAAPQNLEAFVNSFSDEPEEPYQRFLTLIESAGGIDAAMAKQVTAMLHHSLVIDLVLFSVDIVDEFSSVVTDSTIDELTAIVADAGQNIAAISMELGIVKTQYYAGQELPDIGIEYDDEYIREQKELAELGMEDFALLFEDK